MQCRKWKLLALLFLVAPAVGNAACVLSDKELSFSDGSKACMNEFSFLNIKGLMKTIPSESYATKASKESSFSIAVTAQPMLCPFEQSMQWGMPAFDKKEAVASCERKMAVAVGALGKADEAQSCKCEVLIESGKVLIKRFEFEQKTKLYEKQIVLGGRAIELAEGSSKIKVEQAGVAAEAVANEQKRLAMEAQAKEQDRLALLVQEQARVAAEEAAKEQQRLTMEAQVKERARLALLAQEQDRLAREAAAKEQQRLAMEAQAKEQARLALLAQEQDRLAREAAAKEQQRLAMAAQAKEQTRLALVAQEQERLATAAQARERANLLALLEQERKAREEGDKELNFARAQLARLEEAKTRNYKSIVYAKRRALVIGNDSYRQVRELINAREDARSIAQSLQQVGYEVTLKLDLTEKEMKASLRTFKAQVEGGDEVMVFFAGHGVQFGSANYLLPIDIAGESEEQIKDEAISLQRILDDMSEKKAKLTLAMVDACRDNPFKTASRNLGGRGLAATTAATGQMVIFSAGAGQLALDKLGPSDTNKNGVFTRVFLKAMQAPGISIDAVLREVRKDVVELAKTVGHEQVPAIYDQVVGEFYFRR